MPDEVIIEGDSAPAAAPVVVTVITPVADAGDNNEAELIELRAFKDQVIQDRLAQAEQETAEAKRIADLALEISLIPDEEPVIAPPTEEEPDKSVHEDVAPDKSHLWFKEF